MPQETDDARLQEAEAHLRHKLGIPDDARQVILFAESSHWDPNWLYTSEEYYDRFVRANLDTAIAELLREPRRVYSIECIFFLRLYWDRQPEQCETVRSLVNEGRLRLTSSGVTTADTLLPSAEAILRDLLLGQEWLRAQGMTPEPRLAYFTDSFGCSPALPSLLQAAGFDRTSITRIDGMYFPACDYEPAGRFPRAGSSADRLLNQERTLDFVWSGPDGAEVLCHWNAFTYFQGDLLAYRGLNRVYLLPIAVSDRSERNVARRIRQFARQLRPYSRTPYLFCPIGVDFVAPTPDLVALLDRYNQRRYPDTGLWAVNAGLDDYLALVETHRDRLPVLSLDPNPYWTGFYTARPALKERCYELVDRLLEAEQRALLAGLAAAESPSLPGSTAAELEKAWWTAVSANHHDFITGTSPDRVVEEEQIPWLERARATADAVLDGLTPAQVPQPKPPAAPRSRPQGRVRWGYTEGRLRIETTHYALEIDGQAGGYIARAWQPATGQELLGPGSNELISYRDSGGLWRMGHEFLGGRFKEVARASQYSARLEVEERDGVLEVSFQGKLDGQPLQRTYWFHNGSPFIRFRVEGRAAPGRTVTARFETGLSVEHLVMDQPGGVVRRPPLKIYDPTFWPLQHVLYLCDQARDQGLLLGLRRPGAVCYRPGGRLELVALRNATRERILGFIPLMANPATGHERDGYAFDYGLWFTPAAEWSGTIHLSAAEMVRCLQEAPDGPGTGGWAAPPRLSDALVITDRSDVWVTSVKPAHRGEGWIVRLQTVTAVGAPVSLIARRRPLEAAALCDARERDLEPLDVRRGAALLTMPGTIASIRLLLGPAPAVEG